MLILFCFVLFFTLIWQTWLTGHLKFFCFLLWYDKHGWLDIEKHFVFCFDMTNMIDWIMKNIFLLWYDLHGWVGIEKTLIHYVFLHTAYTSATVAKKKYTHYLHVTAEYFYTHPSLSTVVFKIYERGQSCLCCPDYFERQQLLGAESAPLVPIDPDILRLMENESLLIDKECLTLGEEIGKG